MKVEHHIDEKLIARIRRSYWFILEYKKQGENSFSSRLFEFKKMKCEDIEGIHWDALRCIKVKVFSTGETYLATQAISFGKDTWSLYKIVDGPELIEE